MEEKTALFEKERRGMRAVDPFFCSKHTDTAMQVAVQSYRLGEWGESMEMEDRKRCRGERINRGQIRLR